MNKSIIFLGVLLLGTVSSSTIIASQRSIDDVELVKGNFIYEKQPVLEKEAQKAPFIASPKRLPPVYIEDQQQNKYQIFNSEIDNRTLKFNLMNSFNVNFMEDLNNKEISFKLIKNKTADLQNLVVIELQTNKRIVILGKKIVKQLKNLSKVVIVENYLESEKETDLDDSFVILNDGSDDKMPQTRSQFHTAYGESLSHVIGTDATQCLGRIMGYKYDNSTPQNAPVETAPVVTQEQQPKTWFGKGASKLFGKKAVTYLGANVLGIDYKNK